MTTFNLSGYSVADDSGAFQVAPSTLTIVASGKNATFSYSEAEDPEFFVEVEFQGIPDSVYLDGIDLNAVAEISPTYEALIATVDWRGNSSTILEVSWLVSNPDDDDFENYYQSFWFVIDGDQFPVIENAHQWNALEDDFENVRLVSGDFAAGNEIKFKDLLGVTFTEDDEFLGTSGNDRYFGGIGDDYFVSSAGNDLYAGGSGNFDQVNFRNDPNGVYASLAEGKAIDGFGDMDTLRGIEVLRGSMHDDVLIGDGGDNVLRGLAGNDNLKGGGGRDQVRYDIDHRYGGDNGVNVNLAKREGIDPFGDKDKLFGIEDVRGSDADDRITGSEIGNELEGRKGDDRIFGLKGYDKLWGDEGADLLRGGGGNDNIHGGVGRDTLSGENGHDKLFGDGGNDKLSGGKGNDLVSGGAGVDILNGGEGNDRLKGGAGNDVFLFKGDFGKDVIDDFNTASSSEVIDLSGVDAIRGFWDLKTNHLFAVNGDAVIRDGLGNSITLIDVAVDDLAKGDFLF